MLATVNFIINRQQIKTNIKEKEHIPERFTVLVVIENEGINELGEVLRDKGYFVVQESKKNL